mmetsp:Transcript_27840/g.95804  ORF Transcript_27840/g.95804 Transcript_27840/m.95804 type:complete len:213 (-) Transcript_27840:3-641(-)
MRADGGQAEGEGLCDVRRALRRLAHRRPDGREDGQARHALGQAFGRIRELLRRHDGPEFGHELGHLAPRVRRHRIDQPLRARRHRVHRVAARTRNGVAATRDRQCDRRRRRRRRARHRAAGRGRDPVGRRRRLLRGFRNVVVVRVGARILQRLGARLQRIRRARLSRLRHLAGFHRSLDRRFNRRLDRRLAGLDAGGRARAHIAQRCRRDGG